MMVNIHEIKPLLLVKSFAVLESFSLRWPDSALADRWVNETRTVVGIRPEILYSNWNFYRQQLHNYSYLIVRQRRRGGPAVIPWLCETDPEELWGRAPRKYTRRTWPGRWTNPWPGWRRAPGNPDRVARSYSSLIWPMLADTLDRKEQL